MFSSVSGLLKSATGNNQRADKITKATRTSPADVVRTDFSMWVHRLAQRFGYADLLERLQGFPDERRHSGGWAEHRRNELRTSTPHLRPRFPC